MWNFHNDGTILKCVLWMLCNENFFFMYERTTPDGTFDEQKYGYYAFSVLSWEIELRHPASSEARIFRRLEVPALPSELPLKNIHRVDRENL